MKRIILAASMLPFLCFADLCQFPIKPTDAVKAIDLKPVKVKTLKEDGKVKTIYQFRKESGFDDPNPIPPLTLQINTPKGSQCPEKMLLTFAQYENQPQLNQDNLNRAYALYSLVADNPKTLFENKLSRLSDVQFFENTEKTVVKFSRYDAISPSAGAVLEFHK